jgi:hypothetical protein
MDGNNSLKRMAIMNGRSAADTRVLDDSTYFLSQEFVDQYANEVQGRGVKGPAVNNEQDSSEANEAKESPEGDPTDGLPSFEGPSASDNSDSHLCQKLLAQCVDNWKSAAKEETKRMWSIFDESGIFASACRHGLILWLIDMVRSGEL